MRTIQNVEELESNILDASSSEGEEGSDSNTSRRSICVVSRSVSIRLMGVGLVLACMCLTMNQSGAGSAQVGQFGENTRGIFKTRELTQLMESQAQSLMDHVGATDDAKEHVGTAIGKMSDFVSQHLNADQLHALENAKIGAQGWNDLKMIMQALQDPRVQELGKSVLHEVRSNLKAGPLEIGKAVVERLERSHLHSLANDVIPRNMRTKLKARWAKIGTPSEEEVWRLLLDPTGETFEHMRSNGTDSVLSRRLNSGTFAHPILNGLELTTGISSCVFISAAEIMLHVDLLVPHLVIPNWAHAMLFVPGMGLGAASCTTGMSFWCDYFYGALGLNAVDAIAWGSGFGNVIDGPGGR